MTGKYVYGIIEEAETRHFPLSGIGEAEVYTINHRGIAAVVSDTSMVCIDPARKHVLAHTVVQDRLLRDYTLLPAGFGLIAGSEDEVRFLLERNRLSLLGELRRLAGKVEFGLRCAWDREAVLGQLETANGELSRIKARLKAALSPRDSEPLLMEAGKLVERVAAAWRDRYAGDIFQRLKAFAADARSGAPAGVTSLLNASFLIERAGESRFLEEVYRLDDSFQGKINFKCVGPLPPYSFVNAEMVRFNAAASGI